jgi:biofilm PGA synthesis N-glycosyltransferase PgaC
VELLLFVFVFFYPLFMAVYWMTGAIIFFNRREHRNQKPPNLKEYPHVAILVPCHNESACIEDAIIQLAKNNYPSFEIIAINDGSSDDTGDILGRLTQKVDKLRVINLTRNYGKATALKVGALSSNAEFIMCIDADALLDKDALFWMMKHFQEGPRVGAVTGNPRVVNKTSLLARIQIGEFSAIVGMVKRTQRNIGRIFTVSGVNTMFRLAALHDVKYWSTDTVTEDIDISWKLQMRYWDIRYEPRALTWILVPETLTALWKQRLRWAQGGYEAATKFSKQIFRWENRRMWIVSAEYWMSVLWCYALMFTILCFFGTNFAPEGVWPEPLRVPSLIPGWTGVILATVCLTQFAVGLALDSIYERRGLFRYIFWAIWYPAVYWLLSAATTVVAVPKAMVKKRKRRAVWTSPTRMLQYAPLRVRETQQKSELRRMFWKIVPQTKKYAELMVMFVSWSLWAYLITPLVSLVVWGYGSYLFMDRLITPGSYETFERVTNYGLVITVMWVLMAAWIVWNQQRYGRQRNRRCEPLPKVTPQQMADTMGLEIDQVELLRKNKETYLYIDERDLPVIETSAPAPAAVGTR